MNLTLVYFMIAIAAMFNAGMDVLVYKWSESIFTKWGDFFGENSWKNKYIDRIEGNGRIKWKIFGITFNKPVQLTDGWHLFKTICIMALMCGMGLSTLVSVNSLVLFISGGLVWNIVFDVFYGYLFITKK